MSSRRLIKDYDGLAVRSATKVTGKVIEAAKKLRVVGRAGIGVDNIDVKAATAKGIIVMNTPFGNSITTAEHALSLMMALARQIPAADASTQAGKWEKSKFMGVELSAKTLGIIGCGNIGSIVADRAIGLRMKVIAFDPFLSPERAVELGVEKVELDDLLRRADFITLHTPLTDKTRNILDAGALKKTKKGVRIVNCARGGLVDEKAMVEALKSGHVGWCRVRCLRGGARQGERAVRPAQRHLHAAPRRGDLRGARERGVAGCRADVRLPAQGRDLERHQFSQHHGRGGAAALALREARGPAGQFRGPADGNQHQGIEPRVLRRSWRAEHQAADGCGNSGRPAPAAVRREHGLGCHLAKERGIAVEEVTRTQEGAFESYIRLTVRTDKYDRSIAGTVFSDGRPRIIQVRDIDMEFELRVAYAVHPQCRQTGLHRPFRHA